jgi:hypothetical protein
VCLLLRQRKTSTANCVRARPLKYAYSWWIGSEMSCGQLVNILFRRVAKFRGATSSFVVSVRPRGTARLPLDGISWNSISGFFYFRKLSSNFIKIWQERRVLYFKTYECVWLSRQILLRMRMFRTKLVEKSQNTFCVQCLCYIRRSSRFWDNVKKYGEMQATDDNIIRHLHFTCWLHKATYTHSEYIILFVVVRQQCLHERASMLRSCISLHFLFLSGFPILKNNADRRVHHPSKSVYIGIYLIVTTFRLLAVTDYTHIVTFLSLKINGNNSPSWCK